MKLGILPANVALHNNTQTVSAFLELDGAHLDKPLLTDTGRASQNEHMGSLGKTWIASDLTDDLS